MRKIKNINQLHYQLQARSIDERDIDLLRHFSDLKLASVYDQQPVRRQSLLALHKWAASKRVASTDKAIHLMMGPAYQSEAEMLRSANTRDSKVVFASSRKQTVKRTTGLDNTVSQSGLSFLPSIGSRDFITTRTNTTSTDLYLRGRSARFSGRSLMSGKQKKIIIINDATQEEITNEDVPGNDKRSLHSVGENSLLQTVLSRKTRGTTRSDSEKVNSKSEKLYTPSNRSAVSRLRKSRGDSHPRSSDAINAMKEVDDSVWQYESVRKLAEEMNSWISGFDREFLGISPGCDEQLKREALENLRQLAFAPVDFETMLKKFRPAFLLLSTTQGVPPKTIVEMISNMIDLLHQEDLREEKRIRDQENDLSYTSLPPINQKASASSDSNETDISTILQHEGLIQMLSQARSKTIKRMAQQIQHSAQTA